MNYPGTILLVLASINAFAQPVQSLDLLRKKVEQYALETLNDGHDGRVSVSLEKTDSRLRLKACQESMLYVFNPHAHALLQASTLGVRCQEADNHWTLYIPVKISLFRNVYVLTHSLRKGQIIRDEDLRLAEKDIRQLKKGYFLEKNEIVGLSCKQTLMEGSLITPQDVQQVKVILKGQQVSIFANKEGFSVKMSGVALNDGALGDNISVRNLSSKKIIEAKVSGAQQVEVTL